MPPPTQSPVPAVSDSQHGVIVLTIAITVATVLILALLALAYIFFRHRRTTPHPRFATIPHHPVKNLPSHKNTCSDASTNALLTHNAPGRWGSEEKYLAHEWSLSKSDGSSRYPIMSTPSNGSFHLPNHPFGPTALVTLPTAPGHRPPYTLASNSSQSLSQITQPKRSPQPRLSPLVIPVNNPLYPSQPRLPPLVAPENKPPPPRLPPLIIPNSKPLYPQRLPPSPVSEPSSPPRLPSRQSSTASSLSLYSQSTAEPSHSVPSISFLQLPLSQESKEPADNGLQRGETRVVGNLLKARAQRNLGGLTREATQVSHIERIGSIRSAGSLYEDDRPFLSRFRSKKRKGVRKMNSVTERSEDPSSPQVFSASFGYEDSLRSSVFDSLSPLPVLPPRLDYMGNDTTLPLRIEPKRVTR